MTRRVLLSLVALVALDRAIGLGLELASRDVHDGERTGGLVRAVVDHPQTDVLLLGSSRVRRHLDPRRLEAALGRSVRNAGCDGQGVAYARSIAALARAHGSHASLYVVDVNPFDLIDAREARSGVLSPYYGQSPVVDALLEARSTWAPLYLQSHTYRFNSSALPLLFRALRGREGDDDRGFAPLASRQSPIPDAAPSVGVVGTHVAQARGLAHYEALVREAREANVEVVFVVGPVRDSWTADDMRRIAAIEARVREAGATVIDLRRVAMPSTRWVDAIHLDAEGADELSRRLAASLSSSASVVSSAPDSGA